jgi:hypothetical protein
MRVATRLSFAAALTLAGCGPDNDKLPGGLSIDTDDVDTDDGGDTPIDTENRSVPCDVPPGATIIADWHGSETGAPIYSLTHNQRDLIYTFIDRVMAVDIGGGTPREIFRSQKDIPIMTTLWRRPDRLALVNDSGSLHVVDPEGLTSGASFTPDPPLSAADIDPATGLLYGRFDDLIGRNADYYRVDTDGGAATPLVLDIPEGYTEVFRVGGGAAYTASQFANPVVIRRYPLSAFGPSVVPIEMPPGVDLQNLADATDGALYVAGIADDLSEYGLYRTSPTGGPAVHVAQQYITVPGESQAFTDGMAFHYAGHYFVLYGAETTSIDPPFESGRCTDGAGPDDGVACTVENNQSCITYGVTVHDDRLFSTLYNVETKETLIFYMNLIQP